MSRLTLIFALKMIATVLANPTTHHFDGICPSVMAKAGLNTTTFKEATSHGIHSITVQDLRYYFDESIPEESNIPTVNLKLTGSHVLPSAPLGGTEFQTPAMRMLDLILSTDDGSDNFMIRGATRIEKIAHGVHMLELWHKTSKVFQKIRNNPPSEQVCSCATDDANNGILEELRKVSIFLRNFGASQEDMKTLIMGEDKESNQLEENSVRFKRSPAKEAPKCYSYRYSFWGCSVHIVVKGKRKRSTDNISLQETADEMPELKDVNSWGVWKSMLNYSMLDDNEIFHLAMYLYCKISALKDY